MRTAYNGISAIMPKKTVAKETVATAPVRAAKPKTVEAVVTKTVTKVASASPRVRTAKHSKAAGPAYNASVVSTPVVTAPILTATVAHAHDAIAKIAYGYWEARGYQHGSSEQDWLRAEQEYLLSA